MYKIELMVSDVYVIVKLRMKVRGLFMNSRIANRCKFSNTQGFVLKFQNSLSYIIITVSSLHNFGNIAVIALT